MGDVECYNQPLIDMKEQYQKNVEMFTITTQLLSNNMQFTCILGASWATQIYAELVHIQVSTMTTRDFDHIV
jgi:hypothetical protein